MIAAPPWLEHLAEQRYGCVRGVGIDLLEVGEVREAIAAHGDRYLRRVFTAHELASCERSADYAARLAARYAAKEATIKALKPAGHQPDWRSMELRRHPAGWCDEMRLSGTAQVLARERGIEKLLVSISHEKDSAVAIVVAVGPVHRGPCGPSAIDDLHHRHCLVERHVGALE